MTKKKGFTLVELIAVIAILGVILTIAGISIVSIRKNVVAKQKENVQATAKIAAQGYYKDTGVDSVSVGILLQIGALQADNVEYENAELGIKKGDPVILDPVDGRAMNCDTIDFDVSGNATYTEHEICDTKVIEDNALTIQLQLDNESLILYTDEYQENNWIRTAKDDGTQKKIYFSSVIHGVAPSGEVGYTWTNPLNPDVSATEAIFELKVPETGLINETYNLLVDFKDKALNKNFSVKVDAKKPTIENVSVQEQDTWTTSKNIIATLIDNESRLYGYKVVKGNGVKCTDDGWNTSIQGENRAEIAYNTNVNSKYYKICVKDNAGYITETKDYIVAEKIDYNAPELTVTVQNGDTWKQSNTAKVTVTEKGPDGTNISGFPDAGTITFKYDWLNKASAKCSELKETGTITVNKSSNTFSKDITISGVGTSYNGDGNFFICPAEGGVKDIINNTLPYNANDNAIQAKMKLDGVNPSATFTISTQSTYSYNSKNAQYTISNAKDNASGIDKMCIQTSSDSSDCNWITAKNGTTKYTFSSSDGSGATEKLYFFLKDKTGNMYSTDASYTLYAYCTKTTSSESCGSCNAGCGSGSMRCTTTYKDKYFKSHSCGSDSSYESCYAGACYDPDPEPSYSSSSSTGGGSTCDITCQMQKNSEDWYDCTTQKCRDDLHDKNVELAEKNSDCGTGKCSYDEHAGTWSDDQGDRLYYVNGK